MLKRGGTKLSVIDQHKLYVMCNCGHADSVWVRDVIKALGDQVTVGFAIDKMRCSKCGMKNVKEYRITYPGGSADAMRSADQSRPREYDG
ncbi:hypothetical protein [Nisaea sp.]|uniref:hypothetical protein n=1 Tax=Nisaea sp. TaxID=2024842 RepID=UPI0032973D0F